MKFFLISGYTLDIIRGMIKVERHVIKGTPELVRLCSLGKELYNRCNFFMRQAFFEKELPPNISILRLLVKDDLSFINFNHTKIAMQVVRQVLTDWANFRKATTAWFKDNSKFLSKPKPPNYKNKLAQIIFYNETIRKKPLKLGIITPTNDCFTIKSKHATFKQVVVTPKTFGFIVDVQYEVENVKVKTKKDRNLSIDLGVNNLCSITSDQLETPILVNGRIVKSINQVFNKRQNKKSSKKRYFRLENYFHHVSKFIVDLCIKKEIGQIIIGKNDNWKQRIKIGKINNQNFQYIPFNKLIQKIQYKADSVGIKVAFTEESYTSKASFKDRDPLDGSKISGTRLKRGLYQTANGELLNADINGSANIFRKVIKDVELIDQLDRSLVARPVRVNPLKIR